mmetsp:Transcript_12511/g.37569  ORF Transcript_12511/g.37569 Transcript_12511/m.37569 type:complete len:226 (+) Transcript_12511:1026-1703(+)
MISQPHRRHWGHRHPLLRRTRKVVPSRSQTPVAAAELRRCRGYHWRWRWSSVPGCRAAAPAHGAFLGEEMGSWPYLGVAACPPRAPDAAHPTPPTARPCRRRQDTRQCSRLRRAAAPHSLGMTAILLPPRLHSRARRDAGPDRATPTHHRQPRSNSPVRSRRANCHAPPAGRGGLAPAQSAHGLSSPHHTKAPGAHVLRAVRALLAARPVIRRPHAHPPAVVAQV